MIDLKKYVLKHFTKIKVIRSAPGRIRLKLASSAKFPKQSSKYMHYLEEAITMLDGVDKVTFNNVIGTILIEYNINIVYEAKILKWMDTIIETGIDNFDLIKNYGAKNLSYVEKKLKRQLGEAVKYV
ncbi:hypothetical protein KM803_15675 [Clostridium tyrobutyricum]|uniref:HMA2 domain-containing protein n=1 Tax=Clostridium tyrobutyricum TaxID=1519 RepID=UPI0010AA5231|nr:hypothetical protein [Clostridium tyrobutyricum]MBV4432741.1 hypothetical protein [Clostridium tyrobutyricum]MBV4447871.1 hypothetical protein [Clostridium tyrobutyricum]QCH26896.1 hypothetical protein EZN00_00485 [Clostridium tyrobutyricum]